MTFCRLTNDLGPDSNDQLLLDGAAFVATDSQLGFRQQQHQHSGRAPRQPASVASRVDSPNGRDAWSSRGDGAWCLEFEAPSCAAAEDPVLEDSRAVAGKDNGCVGDIRQC